MMTRKLLAGAAFFVVGIGAASANAQILSLKGSDTLEDIAKDAITAAGSECLAPVHRRRIRAPGKTP